MKTSLNWLKHYINIPWPARELAERLTMAGLEVEEIAELGAIPPGVVVAEILERQRHPDADRLSVCQVDAGTGRTLQIVCGAPNCDVGVKVPAALPGALLGEGFKIKKAKLRGVDSEGMLCSARELGLGDEQAGLMELPPDAVVGTELANLVQADTMIDWEVTPNRPDWLSHLGIAREVAALTGGAKELRLPEIPEVNPASQSLHDQVQVEVQDAELCPRYTARLIRNVKIGPSPAWIKQALEAVGVRPINNVVDITNFVLLECGQPLHAFDFSKLAGGKIVVRRAQDQEEMITLDGKTHRLTPDNLLIADAERGVALAGVMGGENSEIGDSTSTVLLESAAFQPSNIRATAKRLGISTDSSYRFERGVDLNMVEFASRRAAALICQFAGGEILDGVIDVYPAAYVPHHVSCRISRVSDLIGVTFSAPEIRGYFERLGLTVTGVTADEVRVAIPSFRLDLWREADLIEEVARLYGLDNLPGQAAAAQVGGSMREDAYYGLETTRAELLAAGLSECLNYTLLSARDATTGTGVEEDELVTLLNPISLENACLRPSLLPGLLQTVERNLAHQNESLALFEIGRVIQRRPGMGEERYQAGLVLTGQPHPERFGTELQQLYDFYDLKGILEGWFANRRIVGMQCSAATHAAFRDGRSAVITAGDGQTLAIFGEVKPNLTRHMRLNHPLFIALVDLDNILAAATRPRVLEPLPQFPSTSRDISLIAPVNLPSRRIIEEIQATACAWLQNVTLFDVYKDEAVLGGGKRSLAYSLTYRDNQRTLTDEEVNRAHEKIKHQLASKLPVDYR